MVNGIEFLELIYGQLYEAGIIRSKGEFSGRLLGKSPSYLTSMRAKQRGISGQVIMGLGDALLDEIDELGTDPANAEIRALLRRAVAQVNNYLADQTIPSGILSSPEPAEPLPQPQRFVWLRMLMGVTPQRR